MRRRTVCAGPDCSQALDPRRFVTDDRGALHLLHAMPADVRPDYELVCESRVASPSVQPAAWLTRFSLQHKQPSSDRATG